MKNMLLVPIIVSLIVSGIGTATLIKEKFPAYDDGFKRPCSTLEVDELDQYQTIPDMFFPIGNTLGAIIVLPRYNYSAAQSFIPTKEVLTRVQLLIGKNSAAIFPYVLAICGSLTGENLAISRVNPNEVSAELPSLIMVEFEFDDIKVTPGQTYYLVSYTVNFSENYYGWGANPSNLYPNGNMFYSIDGEDWDTSSYDMCFMTYGRNDSSPSVDLFNPKEGYSHFSGIPIHPTPFDFPADTKSLGGFRLLPIQIEVTDDLDIADDIEVEIYLNGDKEGTAEWNEETGYYEWQWTGWALGTYMLNVTAEDTRGNIGSAEIEVWNFCFIP